MWIRTETQDDLDAIAQVIGAAFAEQPGNGRPEQRIVDALREAGALTLSLVADIDGRIAGCIAFSPITISSPPGSEAAGAWFGLGPVAVLPQDQRHSVGKALVRAGGCVVLGEPRYYQQFGFRAGSGLRLANVPAEYFMALSLGGAIAQGEVRYHPAFGLTGILA